MRLIFYTAAWIVGFCEGAWGALTEKAVTRAEAMIAWALVILLSWRLYHQ